MIRVAILAVMRALQAGLALLVATSAFATPQQYDANDLWITPGESGWGLNLFHQGDTLFASLFVYGNDGRARWYTASSLVGQDGGIDAPDPTYTGALAESTGPAIGTSFDPARVTRRQVGTMSVRLRRQGSTITTLPNYAEVSYTVDGVAVSKIAYPFSFVPMGLSGSYSGYLGSQSGPLVQVTNADVTLAGGSFSMRMTSAAAVTCNYAGQQAANGSLFHVGGSYSCSDGASGEFTLRDVDVTRNGFTAKFFARGMPFTDITAQRSSASIRGDGYTTDLWLAPGESGWGLNIVEQGDTLFGTLFVYDSAGQSRWYSASDLHYEPCAPPDAASDCFGRYRGALVESTGPYFGTSFNASAVQRRQVGTMSIDFFGNDTAYLEYTVDGVSLARKELRRFAFRGNSLSGIYAGHMTALGGQNDRGVYLGAMALQVNDSGGGVTMTMSGSRFCTMHGTARFQYGRKVMVSGPYDCDGTPIGRLELVDLYVTYEGFTGSFLLDGYPIGRIEGVRTERH